MKKTLRTTLTLLLAVTVTGCYGPFSLTRKVHHFNGHIGNKWVNEAAFVGMVIFPVYFFATLGDALIFNSIQFWTGSNPINAKATRTVTDGQTAAVLNYSPEARRLRVDQFQNGRPAGTVIVEPSAAGMVARTPDGKVLARTSTEDGMLVVKDGAGKELARRPVDKLAL